MRKILLIGAMLLATLGAIGQHDSCDNHYPTDGGWNYMDGTPNVWVAGIDSAMQRPNGDIYAYFYNRKIERKDSIKVNSMEELNTLFFFQGLPVAWIGNDSIALDSVDHFQLAEPTLDTTLAKFKRVRELQDSIALLDGQINSLLELRGDYYMSPTGDDIDSDDFISLDTLAFENAKEPYNTYEEEPERDSILPLIVWLVFATLVLAVINMLINILRK